MAVDRLYKLVGVAFNYVALASLRGFISHAYL